MAKKLRKGCVTTIYYAKFFIARACICAGSGFLLFISRFLTLSHLCEASHKWVFGNETDEETRKRMEDACREYGGRAKYFDAREIGEELLLCTMFSEELIEKLEEMEEF